MRMNRWAKNGVLDRVFERLQQEQLIHVNVEDVGIDPTIVKVHPHGTGTLKKGGSPVNRKVPRGTDHQDAYGCRR